MMEFVLQHKISTGIFMILIGLAFMCLHGGKRKDKPRSIAISYMLWVFVIMGFISVVCGVVGYKYVPNNIVDVIYDTTEEMVSVTTVSTTLYTTLMTVNLALIALVVTAYIFLIGTLNERDVYEKSLIDEMISKRTRELIILSGYTGTCVILCLIIDNGKLDICQIDWVRYGIVAASSFNTLVLTLFIYNIISYENQLCTLAIKNIKKLAKKISLDVEKIFQKNKDICDAYKEENRIIKRIGDLETFVNQILKNHEVEYRYSRHKQEMLNDIFNMKTSNGNNAISENMCIQYFRLLKLRDCYLSGRKRIGGNLSSEERLSSMVKSKVKSLMKKGTFGDNKNILRVDEISKVTYVIELLWDYLKNNILTGERFIDQSFSNVQFNGEKTLLSEVSFRNSAISDCSYDGADMKGADFTGVLFHNTSMKDIKGVNTIFSEVKFYDFIISQKSDFEGAVFVNADFNANEIGGDNKKEEWYKFKETSCNKANFVGCRIKKVDFDNSVFKQALLSHTEIIECRFEFADFTGAILAEANLTDCKLDYANLESIVGSHSTWKHCKANGIRMAEANYAKSKIENSSFIGAYAHDSSFRDAELIESHFDHAIMNKADFSNVQIRNCYFVGTNLSETLLSRLDTSGGDICIANFTDANFAGAQIKNIVFQDCHFDNTIFNNSMLENVTFKNCYFHNAQFLATYMMNVRWEGIHDYNSFEKFLDKIEFATESDYEGFSHYCKGMNKAEKLDLEGKSVRRVIFNRRSTRNFDEHYHIAHSDQRKILEAGLRAPSPKNRQPWFFTVIDSRRKLGEIATIMEKGLQEMKTNCMETGEDYADLDMAIETAHIIRKASMIVFAEYTGYIENTESGQANDFETVDLQSIGAAVQNMLLQATEIEISSLWIGDVLYVKESLMEYLKLDYPFVAAIAFGKAMQFQSSREEIEKKVKWLEDTHEENE